MDGDRTIIERIARYMASRQEQPAPWPHHVEEAASLLALIKDPDAAMIQAGDAAVWRHMIDAALVERWEIPGAIDGPSETIPGGGDEEGDVPLTRRGVTEDKTASWITIRNRK